MDRVFPSVDCSGVLIYVAALVDEAELREALPGCAPCSPSGQGMIPYPSSPVFRVDEFERHPVGLVFGEVTQGIPPALP